jgi:acetoin utilization protein AcuC
MKTAFIYSDDFARFDYGSSHPLKLVRLKLTYELIKACGLLVPSDHRLIKPSPASIEDLLAYHTREYIDILRSSNSGRHIAGAEFFGLGPGDNPVFPGMYDGSLLVAGASLRAAELVDCGEVKVAFNIAGGLHHAMADHASGFCYINDPVIAIKALVSRGRRVTYIDIDAHHGDGVQAAFYDTDQVLTISLHETGLMLFPGSGFEQGTGTGAGKGYSVNVPLPPDSDDELFTYAFTQVFPSLIKAYKPDIVVSQLGVDTFRNDPLAHLNLTTNGFCEMVSMIKALAPKWLALGGGGYDIANVARAWTLAWAIINDAAAPEDIPEDFLQKYPLAGFSGRKLRDEPFVITGSRKKEMKAEVDGVIASIRQNIKLLNGFKTV